jgi:YidC/Oxa1 family membrane protein insertase
VHGGSPAAVRGIREATILSSDLPLDRRRHVIRLLLVLATVGLAVAALGGGSALAQGESPVPTATPAATASTSASPAATDQPAAGAADCQPPIPTFPPGHPKAGQHEILCPATPSGDPVGLLAWLFNPIFQTLFLGLVAFYSLIGDIGIAIILLTLAIKTLLIPLFRSQIVSQRRMQLLQPEIKAIGTKFKGNRQKVSEETMRLYRERGINPAAGCLPAVLQLFLLIPIYSVINTGLSAIDISSALQFLGQPLTDLVQCVAPGTLDPCINPTINWLGGLDAHQPEILFRIPGIDFGVSALALVAALFQLIQTRMMTPSTNDPQTRSQQRIFMFFPLISIVYGSFLPAGLFLYWIVFTLYSIVQQYLIVGWGALFPLFGWMPEFARNHEPRFPVTSTPVTATKGGKSQISETPVRTASDSAAGTIRPARQRGRTSRRGRRR